MGGGRRSGGDGVCLGAIRYTCCQDFGCFISMGNYRIICIV